MKHIKTPVSVGRGMIFETDVQGLPVPLADIYCEGVLSGNTEKAQEIALALNVHDELVDTCKAQRDALAILQAAMVEAGATLTISERVVYQGALLKADAVLGKVEGEREK